MQRHSALGRPVRLGSQPPQQKAPSSLDQTTSHSQGVRVIACANPEEVGRQAAAFVAEQLRQKPNAVVVFPTGNTPLPMYRELRQLGQNGLDWRQSHLFHLDEYIFEPGIAPRCETFAQYMHRELWSTVAADKHEASAYQANPMGYEAKIRELGGGKPDLVILGIGKNGHVAFNEPPSNDELRRNPNLNPADAPTRIVKLAETTRLANFGQHAGEPGYPKEAMTLGLKAILDARRILLLATGADKETIVRQAFDPTTPPTPKISASYLKTHPNVTVLTDFGLAFSGVSVKI